VRRSLPFRLLSLAFALLGSLLASGLAVSHGLVHEHLAHEHRAGSEHHGNVGEHHVVAGWAVALASDGDPAHGHLALDVVPASRDLGRLDVPRIALCATSSIDLALATLVVVRSPALTEHALLARPEPLSGPPKLRAPPVG
jgi:hypothetical protein